MGWSKPDERQADNWMSEALEIYRSVQQGRADSSGFAKGLALCEKAGAIYRSLNSKREISCLNIAGALHRAQNNRAAAIECEKKGLDLIRRFSPSSESEVQSLNNLAALHRESYAPECMADERTIQHFVDALRCAVQASVLCHDKFQSSQWRPLALYHLGHILAEMGDVEAAKRLLTKCSQLAAASQPGLVPNCQTSLKTLQGASLQHEKHKQLAEYILSKRSDWPEIQRLLKQVSLLAR